VSNADGEQLDPELDALLATARWPEPAPQAVPRLRDEWRDFQRQRRMRIGWWMATAAAVLIAVGGTWVLFRSDRRPLPRVAQAPVAQPPIMPRPQAMPPRSSAIVARPPTPAERLVILAIAAPPLNEKTIVRSAIEAAMTDDADTVAAILKPLRPTQVERELATAFATSTDVEYRRAAVRLLAERGGPDGAPLLNRVARDPTFATEAMPGVARLGGVDPLIAFARTGHPIVRQAAMIQLLAVGTEPVVQQFLAMVLDDRTRADALTAVHAAPQPPVGQFLLALNDARVDQRYAAAKALGSLCDRPDVGVALRQMVNENRNRREALAALLSCPDADAAKFLAAAQSRRPIDSELRAVRTELSRIF
jgi:hypothetical protein